MPTEFAYRIEFYQREDGTKPVRDFLDNLDRRNAVLRKQVDAKLRKLQDSRYHGYPNTEEFDGTGGLQALRIRGANDVRVFFFETSGRRLILVHAFAKKSQRIPKRHLDAALERKRLHEAGDRERRTR